MASSHKCTTGRKEDIKVYDDITITGFGELKQQNTLTHPLPAVEQPLGELGKVAAETLVESTKGGGKKIKTYRTPRSKNTNTIFKMEV